jgi:adenylate cyclase
MPPKLQLKTAQGTVEVACHEVVTIGRVEPNDIVVADPRVSRSHAMVRMLGDGRFYVVDVGSANGTFVNGRRIAVPHELKHGDEIRVGTQAIVFSSDVVADTNDAARGEEQDAGRTLLTMAQQVSQLTVLVADVRGYTSLSQRLSPERLATVMGRLFNDATRVVQVHGGVVDKFIGDAVMARWVADTSSLVQSVLSALKTARDIHHAIERINAGMKDLPAPLRIGCGINTGLAILGTVGSTARREYTALGDAINLAFRLETATKELRTDVAVGVESYRHLPPHLWRERVTTVAVKGKVEPVPVWPLGFSDLEAALADIDKPNGSAAGSPSEGSVDTLPGSKT